MRELLTQYGTLNAAVRPLLDDPKSATLGTELIATSISADFPAQFIAPVTAALTMSVPGRSFSPSLHPHERPDLYDCHHVQAPVCFTYDLPIC